MLYFFRFRVRDTPKETAALRDKVIDNISVGDKFYMDIRYYTVQWYEELPMEDKYDYTYIVECIYVRFVNKKHSKVEVKVIIFDETLALRNNLYVKLYGGFKIWEQHLKIVDKDLVKRNPQLSRTQN